MAAGFGSLWRLAVFTSAALCLTAAPAFADETFTQAVDLAELSELRAGDIAVDGNENETIYAHSTQLVSGTSADNTITAGADVIAGDFSITSESFSAARGITNVAGVTAPNSVAQVITAFSMNFVE